MEKKTSTKSAKSPDEMGEFEIVMTEKQMARLVMLPEEDRDIFWLLIYSHLNRREGLKHADLYSLLWDTLAQSIKLYKERKKQK